MKLPLNILSGKVLIAVFAFSILFQLFIPVLIFKNHNSDVKLPNSITDVNYFSNFESIIESSGRRLDRTNFNSTSEFNNYPSYDFILLNGNYYASSLFHKYVRYASDELIIRNFLASNFNLRSPPVYLS